MKYLPIIAVLALVGCDTPNLPRDPMSGFTRITVAEVREDCIHDMFEHMNSRQFAGGAELFREIKAYSEERYPEGEYYTTGLRGTGDLPDDLERMNWNVFRKKTQQ